MRTPFTTAPLLTLFGLLSLGIAGASIVDMFRPRPYDGIVLASGPERLVVREVVPGSGADQAGIRPGDAIIGVSRELIRDARDAARLLGRRRIGEIVPYFVLSPDGERTEVPVRLGRYQIGGGSYLYVCVVGLSFFFVGLFVLVSQPSMRASQVFFLACGLILLFLVCRLRPASYSGIDAVVLHIGTLAGLFLPSAFLHFYLVFPRAAWLDEQAHRRPQLAPLVRRFGWPVLYAFPGLVFLASLAFESARGSAGARPAGLPMASWWLLTLYVLLGFAALRANASRLSHGRERRGLAMVLIGSIFGLLPFLAVLATGQDSERIFWFGVLPLTLVPLTFTYAIVRFQLLDIRIILRRSLLYTLTTVVVTGIYAFAIAVFSALFRDRNILAERYFPFILALAIVLLFEPLRRRIQSPIDRYFFAGRARLREAIVALGEALTAQVDPQAVVEELVVSLPRLADLRFAALYLLRGDRLARVAGPATLPERIPLLPEVQNVLARRNQLVRIDRLLAGTASESTARLLNELQDRGVEALGDLASSRRWIGIVMLSEKRGQIPFDREELSLLRGLFNQASLALETGMLLDERTHQAELERELQIAARIQADLHPGRLRFAGGWQVAATVSPARDVGGDFIAQLPVAGGEESAVVFGDVSGKSVSGALMMMAAHEVLHALAMTEPRPSRLFDLANQRLYRLGDRRFVALGYLGVARANGDGREDRLLYLVAGQPPLLLRRADGSVHELPLPDHRLPLGALADGGYHELEVGIDPGDLVLGYSDGATEAKSPSGEDFGSERLVAALAAADGGPSDAVRRVRAAIDAFTHEGPLYDDLTLVAVGRPAVESTEELVS